MRKLIIFLVMEMFWFNFVYSQDCPNMKFKIPEHRKLINYLVNGYLDCANAKKENAKTMDGNLNCDQLRPVEKKQKI